MVDEGAQKEESRTPEDAAQEAVNNRLNMFVTKYGELVKEQQVDFAQYPVWVPDGNGGFRTVIQNTPVDVSNSPVKSPIIVQS